MPGLPTVQASSQGWASVGAMWSSAFNSGWVLDQRIGSTGGMTSNVSPSSIANSFYSTGDATAFYVHGRRLWIAQAATNIYAEVVSSSSSPVAGSTTSTLVTTFNIPTTTPLSSGTITSVAASVNLVSTGGVGQGNLPNDYGTFSMIRFWGL